MRHISCGAMIWGLLLWFNIYVGPLITEAMRNDHKLCSSSNYDYKDALRKGILFFEGQRSGKLPPSQRVKWRADSALSDGTLEDV